MVHLFAWKSELAFSLQSGGNSVRNPAYQNTLSLLSGTVTLIVSSGLEPSQQHQGWSMLISPSIISPVNVNSGPKMA